MTFPAPLYQKWIEIYQQLTGVRISYEPLGSGAGIKQLSERAIDFGATDTVLSSEEEQKAPGEILHVPTCYPAEVHQYFTLPSPKRNKRLIGYSTDSVGILSVLVLEVCP